MKKTKILLVFGFMWFFYIDGGFAGSTENLVAKSTSSLNTTSQPSYIITKTFASENKKYIATVKYEKYGGTGRVAYAIQNDKGENLGAFVADMAPCLVYLSNTGNRLVGFGGNWTETMFLNHMVIYAFDGRVVKDYRSKRNLLANMGAANFSKDGQILILGTRHDFTGVVSDNVRHSTNTLALFDIASGDLVKQIPVPKAARFNGIVASDNADWIVVSYSNYKLWTFTVEVFDKAGKSHWINSSKNYQKVYSISPDGGSFYKKEMNRKNKTTTFNYKNSKGKIEVQEDGGKPQEVTPQ